MEEIQKFGGVELYPSLEEKAANLLYFVTKNHSFSDGNKRIAAAMFLYFLDKNGALFLVDAKAEKAIADQTLAALTIMIAESQPSEKEMMINVIMNCMVSEQMKCRLLSGFDSRRLFSDIYRSAAIAFYIAGARGPCRPVRRCRP